MAKIFNFNPLKPFFRAEPPGSSPARAPQPSAPAAPSWLVDPLTEPIPEVRPDLSGIERPTLEDVIEEALLPAFLKTDRAEKMDLTRSLRGGLELLAAGPANGAAAAAAATVAEALADKETLEACRLLLIKG